MKAKTIFCLLISVLFAYHASASSLSVILRKPVDRDTTLASLSSPPPINGMVKKPSFFGKLKAKLVKLVIGKQDATQQSQNGKAKKTKWGLIIALVLVVGGLAALVNALGSMNFH